MDSVISDVFEQMAELPGELIKTAGKQIKGPPKQPQATAAKKRLPALMMNDQKRAAQKMAEIRKELVAPPAEQKRKKDFWAIARNQQYNQTGERKIGGFG